MKKGILLISSGIDSPVAGHLAVKKGIEVIGLHFYQSEKSKEVVERLAKKIGVKKIYLMKHEPVLSGIKKAQSKFTCILCKRMMLRIAEKIAIKERCDFIINGDNLGQVASQTLDNLTTVQSAVKIPIIRPLLTNDKQETVNIAKEIGTYEISIESRGVCKALPKHPATRSKAADIENEEEKININELVDKSISRAEIIKC